MKERHKPNNTRSSENYLRDDAFALDSKEKIALISNYFKKIMQTLGLNTDYDSLKGTPKRVAKMYVEEIFKGLNPANEPNLTFFNEEYHTEKTIIEKDIHFYSNCEHHFVPIIGKASIAYVPKGKVIGLSKLNRLVQYYASRPQLQERLTIEIGNKLKAILNTEDVGVYIDAKHLCISMRGIKDITSSTITSYYSGVFKINEDKDNFLRCIGK